jgi:hypothetical protein
VRPNPQFWGPIAHEAVDVVPQRDGVFSFICWISGVIMIYAFLFGAGKIILGEVATGLVFLAVGFFCGGVIYRSMNKRGWETVIR